MSAGMSIAVDSPDWLTSFMPPANLLTVADAIERSIN
jgi:hypothetical protein